MRTFWLRYLFVHLTKFLVTHIILSPFLIESRTHVSARYVLHELNCHKKHFDLKIYRNEKLQKENKLAFLK